MASQLESNIRINVDSTDAEIGLNNTTDALNETSRAAERASFSLEKLRGAMFKADDLKKIEFNKDLPKELEKTSKELKTLKTSIFDKQKITIDYEDLKKALATAEKLKNTVVDYSSKKVVEKKEEVVGSIGLTVANVAASAVQMQQAIALEKGFSEASRTIEGTAQQLEDLDIKLQDLSSTSLATPIEELYQIAGTGGAMGKTVGEIENFVTQVSEASVALQIPAADLAEKFGTIQSQLHLTNEEMTSLGDQINSTADSMPGKVREIDIFEVLSTGVATAGKSFGLMKGETVALTGSLLALGESPETARTAIVSLLTNLQTASEQPKSFQKSLEIMGTSAEKLKEDIRNKPMPTLIEFLKTLKGFDEFKKKALLTGIMGMGGDMNAVAKMTDTVGLLEKSLGTTTDATQYSGSVHKAYSKSIETADAKITLFKNSLKEMAASAMTPLLPIFKIVIDGLRGVTNWLKTGRDAFSGITEILTQSILLFISMGGAIRVLSWAFGLLSPALVGSTTAIVGFYGKLAPYIAKLTTAIATTRTFAAAQYAAAVAWIRGGGQAAVAAAAAAAAVEANAVAAAAAAAAVEAEATAAATATAAIVATAAAATAAAAGVESEVIATAAAAAAAESTAITAAAAAAAATVEAEVAAAAAVEANAAATAAAAAAQPRNFLQWARATFTIDNLRKAFTALKATAATAGRFLINAVGGPTGAWLIAITTLIASIAYLADKTVTFGNTTAKVSEIISAAWRVFAKSFQPIIDFFTKTTEASAEFANQTAKDIEQFSTWENVFASFLTKIDKLIGAFIWLGDTIGNTFALAVDLFSGGDMTAAIDNFITSMTESFNFAFGGNVLGTFKQKIEQELVKPKATATPDKRADDTGTSSAATQTDEAAKEAKDQAELIAKIKKEQFAAELQGFKDKEAEQIRAAEFSGKTQQEIDKEVFNAKLSAAQSTAAFLKKALDDELILYRTAVFDKKTLTKEELESKKASLNDIQAAYKANIDNLNALEKSHRDKAISLDKEIRDLKKQGQDGLREIARAGMTDTQVAADKQLEIDEKTAQMRQLMNNKEYAEAAALGKELNALALEQAKTKAKSGDSMVAQYDYEQSVKLTTDALQAQKAEEQAKADAAKAAAEAQRLALENLANQISEFNKTLTTGSELNVIVDTKEVDNLKAKIDEAVKPRQLIVATSKQGNKEYTDAETQKFMEIGRSFRNNDFSNLPMPNIAGVSKATQSVVNNTTVQNNGQFPAVKERYQIEFVDKKTGEKNAVYADTQQVAKQVIETLRSESRVK